MLSERVRNFKATVGDRDLLQNNVVSSGTWSVAYPYQLETE